jgi:hypothetical protein
VYVAEATGGRWLHVRIDHREYSIPLGVASGVLIEVPETARPPSAGDAYAVLVSRLDRRSWRDRVVDRDSGCPRTAAMDRRAACSADPFLPCRGLPAAPATT